ncbi:carboxymuconolactone decarboxylase family protein [Marinomonas ostreistagni]|uniref:carboxymuconolactone decarboxylase family protein n=1 Tax=Marinomonas ostreistagni TaxID=359209 RepID=UPI00194DC983|nr:carboxymuconolactone decarboxylase family protein [Marinomonas ostreistagni]MBM6550400.1 carboxymuconolactone decarboxylase family protein [Marinomonas ostreistagni]
MNKKTLIGLAFSLAASAGHADSIQENLKRAVPALAHYNENVLEKDLWQREGLTPRDRSVVSVATLVAAGKTEMLPQEFARALDNGVEPSELSGIVTHLAFYAGWNNALAAADELADVYEDRDIDADDLPGADVELLPMDEEFEAARESNVQKNYAPTSQGVADYTREPLFRDVWLRPDLTPRDRSLVTVSSLVANGQAEQVPFHLNRALDNGLKQSEASEALTQMAFYVNWPNVFTAMPIFQEVFDKRGN